MQKARLSAWRRNFGSMSLRQTQIRALPIRLDWTHTCQKNDAIGMTGITGVASYAIMRTWYVQRQKTLERPSEETGLSKLIQQTEAV